MYNESAGMVNSFAGQSLKSPVTIASPLMTLVMRCRSAASCPVLALSWFFRVGCKQVCRAYRDGPVSQLDCGAWHQAHVATECRDVVMG